MESAGTNLVDAVSFLDEFFLEDKTPTWICDLYNFVRAPMFYYPGGSINHHCGVGGLGVHMAEMVHYYKCIGSFHPYLNTSRSNGMHHLIKGCILVHDLEKLFHYVEKHECTHTSNKTGMKTKIAPHYILRRYGVLDRSDMEVLYKTTGEHRVTVDKGFWGLDAGILDFKKRKSYGYNRLFIGADEGFRKMIEIDRQQILYSIFGYLDVSFRDIPLEVFEAFSFTHLGYSEMSSKGKQLCGTTYVTGICDLLSACLSFKGMAPMDNVPRMKYDFTSHIMWDTDKALKSMYEFLDLREDVRRNLGFNE